MAKRTLYRIDQRTFKAGDHMPPPGDHAEDLTEPQKFAERILRREAGEHRARYRADHLFTFDNPDWSRRYFNGKDNRTLYEVEVDEADIVHSADMDLFNDIANHGQDDDTAKELATQYWNGDKRKGDRVEHLCKGAKVKKVLYTSDQKDALREEIYGIKKPDHDDAGFYEQMQRQFKTPGEDN
ncbi:hypothetical protein RAD15_25480 [Bradyrhizobium sp. 14AA]